MSDQIYNILFLCTGNSARSIIAEAIMNKASKGRFRAFSAGSHPSGKINPYALRMLTALGYETGSLRSKSWTEFAKPDAPALDFVFTVCDDAAGETCPVWPGHPMTAHWGILDPSRATGTESEIAAAFNDTHRMLSQRINIFLSLPLEKIDALSLGRRLAEIGKIEGSTKSRKNVA